MFDTMAAVHWVHIDRPDLEESELKVHLMCGEEADHLNLTECGSDAGLHPREVSQNNTTTGDLCISCLEQFVGGSRDTCKSGHSSTVSSDLYFCLFPVVVRFL
jgi:hypothetical protein